MLEHYENSKDIHFENKVLDNYFHSICDILDEAKNNLNDKDYEELCSYISGETEVRAADARFRMR